MENLDALITDLQAATAAMSAQYDDEDHQAAGLDAEFTACAAEEDTSVDDTWGSSSVGKNGSPPAPPFPRYLPSPSVTTRPVELWPSVSSRQNGFGERGSGGTDSTTAALSVPSRKAVGAATTVSPSAVSPASFPWSKITATFAAPVAAGSPEALPTIRSANHLSPATSSASLGVRTLSPTTAAVAALPTANDGSFFRMGTAATALVSPAGSSKDTAALPLLLPSPPPSRDTIDGFYRDVITSESFYEPQNLTAVRGTLSTDADAPSAMAASAAADCRWRAPQLREQPAGVGISPLVRSSLAHNLSELDVLLQELGAGSASHQQSQQQQPPLQQQQSPLQQQQPPLQQQPPPPQQQRPLMSDVAGRSTMTSAVQEPTRATPRAAVATPDQRAVYAPVLSQRGIAKQQQQQQHGELFAANIFANEYDGTAVRGQAIAVDGGDLQSRQRFEQQELRHQPQEHLAAASFATRELDELMATLSQLKVSTAQSPTHTASSERASPAARPQAADRREQQQQFAGSRPVIDATTDAESTVWSGGLPQHALWQQPQQLRSGLNGQTVLSHSPRFVESSVERSVGRGSISSSNSSGGPPSAASSPSISRGSSSRSGGGGGGDLDNMLGRLETDLSRQGVKVVAKGHCAACDKAVVGQVVTALGRLWHPEHFCCTKCRCELARVSFFERDGLPYCEHDYHELFAPKCARCGDSVIAKCVTALGITWHPECFTCGACARPLADEAFHEKDGSVYCPDDFFDLFSPRCGSCSMPIYDNFVAALNRHWHPTCFVCVDCGAKFNGGSFFDHDGLPFCETHYHARKGSLCSGCQKPVLGRCVAAMGKKFHPEHFACAFCLRQLNKGTFKEQSDKPYCHSCFGKLFG